MKLVTFTPAGGRNGASDNQGLEHRPRRGGRERGFAGEPDRGPAGFDSRFATQAYGQTTD